MRRPVQARRQTKATQQPDAPFGGVELPGFDPIAVVGLKLVVKIVVTLTEGKQGDQAIVMSAATTRVGLSPVTVTKGVDAECHLLNQRDPGDSRNQKTSQASMSPAPIPSDQGRQ